MVENAKEFEGKFADKTKVFKKLNLDYREAVSLYMDSFDDYDT